MIELIEAVPSLTGRLKTWMLGTLAVAVLGLCIYGQFQFGGYMYSLGAASKQQELNAVIENNLKATKAEIAELQSQLKISQDSFNNLNNAFGEANEARKNSDNAVATYAATVQRLAGLRDSERKEFERKLAGVTDPEKYKRAISGYEDNFERCLRHADRFVAEAASYSGRLAQEREHVQALTGYIGERQAIAEKRELAKKQTTGN